MMTPTLDSRAKPKEGDSLDPALLSLLQASSLACIVTDGSLIVQGWSPGVEDLLGWKAGEVLDRPFSRLFCDRTAADLCKVTGNPTGPVHIVAALRKSDGQSAQVEMWGSTLSAKSIHPSGHIFVLQDSTEKKFLEEALLESAEREQRRIGQKLHDHLCQHLLGAAFAAKALAGALDRDRSSHAPQLHDLARLINDAVTQVRDISRGLHPVELDAAGLMSALQELANRAGPKCTFRCNGRVLVKNSAAALNAYRIAQEAVTAGLQETGAKRIEVGLSQSGSSVCLEISDDGGREGELTANPSGFAAKTMHYRARAMEGSLTLNFAPGKGTRVACQFPL